MRTRRKKGFTLVELIVVMAIMAILAAVAVPLTVTYIRRAQETVDSAYSADIASQAYFVIADLSERNEVIDPVSVVNGLRKNYGDDFPYPIVAVAPSAKDHLNTLTASEIKAYSDSQWSGSALDISQKFYAVYVDDGTLNVYFFEDGAEVTAQRVSRLIEY